MRRLRVAVIGAGRLGGFHAQKLAARDDVELVAVVDPVPVHRNRVAEACGTRAMPDYRLLLDRVDAAVIATPTRFHHTVGLDFLNYGVHLLVEKPLCSRLAEANDLVEMAQRKRVVLQVGHVERFNPAFVAATAAMDAVKYLEATRTGGFTCRSTDVGVVLDLMIHDIDLALSLVRSRVRQVDSVGFAVVGDREDFAEARIEFESGCVAVLRASRVSHEPVRRMQVWGMQKMATIDLAARTAFTVHPSATICRREFAVDRISPEEVDYYQNHFMAEHLPREESTFEAVDALALELQDFVEAIQTRRVPRVSGAAGRDAIGVAEQILSNMTLHKWPDLATPLEDAQAAARPSIVPAPHFTTAASKAAVQRRAAG